MERPWNRWAKRLPETITAVGKHVEETATAQKLRAVLLGVLQLQACRVNSLLGKYLAAERRAVRAEKSYRDAEIPGLVAGALTRQGDALLQKGDHDCAEERLRNALVTAERAGDDATHILALCSIANIHLMRDELDAALELFGRALPFVLKVKDQKLEGLIAASRGLAFLRKSEDPAGSAHLPAAVLELERALELFDETGAKDSRVVALNNLGRALKMQGRSAAALELHNRAFGLSREIGYRRGEARSLSLRGALFAATGDQKRAIDDTARAISIYRDLDLSRDREEMGLALARLEAGEKA